MAALLLSWSSRNRIGDPEAEKMVPILQQVFEPFDLAAADPELLEWANQTLRTEITAAMQRLSVAGTDLMSPLQPAKSEHVDREESSRSETREKNKTESDEMEAL